MNILSLGAGVQSTALCLMSLHGDLPLFDAAIFADTGGEPENVYTHLHWLERQIDGRFPLYRVSAGNLEQDVLTSVREGQRVAQPPFFVKNSDTLPSMPPTSGGMLWRQCTQEYKLEVIRRQIRALWKESDRSQVRQYVGISTDEAERMRESDVKYIANVYALFDMGMSRRDCLQWLVERGYSEPPKSACYFCPYTSHLRWRLMKRDDPATFARAVEFDKKIRQGKLPGVTGDVYLHRSFLPLAEAVDRKESIVQEDLFDPYGMVNECSGMCGV